MSFDKRCSLINLCLEILLITRCLEIYVSTNVHNCPYLPTDSLSDAQTVRISRNQRDSHINCAAGSLWVSFSRHQYPGVTWHCQSWRRFPFRRLDGTPGTICKRQLLYMYLMFTHKSSNFRTIMVLEIIPSARVPINFPNILFVYSRPLTRKRFSVVNSPNKWCLDASRMVLIF